MNEPWMALYALYLQRGVERKEPEAVDRGNAEHLQPHGYAPGDYQCRCGKCAGLFIGDKRAVRCRVCAEISFANTETQ